MTNKQPWVEIDEDLYEALHFSALAFGGVGGGEFFAPILEECIPVCLFGHVGAIDVAAVRSSSWDLRRISVTQNDQAVARINVRRGEPLKERVPFKALMREMRIRPRRAAAE